VLELYRQRQIGPGLRMYGTWRFATRLLVIVVAVGLDHRLARGRRLGAAIAGQDIGFGKRSGTWMWQSEWNVKVGDWV
jgi:hypothetical protein